MIKAETDFQRDPKNMLIEISKIIFVERSEK